MSLFRANKNASIRDLHEELVRLANDNFIVPSIRHVGVVIANHRFTYKRLKRECGLGDPGEQFAYLDELASQNIPPWLIYDVDATSTERKKFERLYGRELANREAVQLHWTIGGLTCTVIAAICVHGFVSWRIFFAPIDADCVQLFVATDLAPLLCDGAWGIFDGASVHKTPATLSVLDNVFQGRFRICSPYSPRLKPIERAFALVWRLVRDLYRPGANVCELLHRCFFEYSLWGRKGPACANLFSLYERNFYDFQQ